MFSVSGFDESLCELNRNNAQCGTLLYLQKLLLSCQCLLILTIKNYIKPSKPNDLKQRKVAYKYNLYRKRTLNLTIWNNCSSRKYNAGTKWAAHVRLRADLTHDNAYIAGI